MGNNCCMAGIEEPSFDHLALMIGPLPKYEKNDLFDKGHH